jgi:hypothetical protein
LFPPPSAAPVLSGMQPSRQIFICPPTPTPPKTKTKN